MISPRLAFGVVLLMGFVFPVHGQLPRSITQTKRLLHYFTHGYIVGSCISQTQYEFDYFTEDSVAGAPEEPKDIGADGSYVQEYVPGPTLRGIEAYYKIIDPTHLRLIHFRDRSTIGIIEIVKVTDGGGWPDHPNMRKLEMTVKMAEKVIVYENDDKVCVEKTARLGSNQNSTHVAPTASASNVPDTPYVRAVRQCLPNNEILKFGPLFKRGEALVSDVLMRGVERNETVRAVFQQAEDDKKLYLVEVSGGMTVGKTCNTLVRK